VAPVAPECVASGGAVVCSLPPPEEVFVVEPSADLVTLEDVLVLIESDSDTKALGEPVDDTTPRPGTEPVYVAFHAETTATTLAGTEANVTL
jgi:hypothetical protein